MVNLFGLTIEDKLTFSDLSFFVVILGLIIYYFGKLISDSKPQKEDRTATYFDGFYFLTLYLLVPPIILYSIYLKYFRFSLFSIILLVVQILILRSLERRANAANLQALHLKEFIFKEIDYGVKRHWFLKKFRIGKDKNGLVLGLKIFEKRYFSKFVLGCYLPFGGVESTNTIIQPAPSQPSPPQSQPGSSPAPSQAPSQGSGTY